jgi:putative phosphoribosyl transferase
MPFRDRADSGRRLAAAVTGYNGSASYHSRLAARRGTRRRRKVARALDAPLDLLLVRKIGVPFQPELAMDAVVDGPRPLTVPNDDIIQIAGVSESDFGVLRDREIRD